MFDKVIENAVPTQLSFVDAELLKNVISEITVFRKGTNNVN